MLALGVLVVPVTATAAVGDVGVQGLSHSGTGTPTGTKRQTNALWFNDGIWWGNLWDTATSDFHIFRFNAATSSWVDTGVTTETRANTHHDVLWDGSTLYVASYRFVNDGLPAEPNFPSTMRRYSYNASTKTYSRLGSSSDINNHKVETLSIDKDSTGRVWATWQQGNRIYLNVTGTDGATWGTPFPHPASLGNVSVDDTSALIAFGPGKVGVMWSRQVGDATDGMYWSSHVDGGANTSWTTPVAAVKGLRSGDDHMNLKWLDASTGRVFAAIKTSFTSASQPLIQLLAFNGTAWSAHTIATVAECPNRVIVMIDESTQRLRTFATYPKPSGTTNAGVCTSSGGAIYEKSTPLDSISFTTAKTARVVDADQYVHNVTSTKQNLNSTAWGTANSGLLVLADVNATSRYWHYYDPSGGAGGGGGGTTETVTLTATADSYVSSGTAGANFGTSTTMRVDNSPVEATYLKFDLSPYAGRTLSGATLQLRSGGNGSAGTQNVKLVATDSWTESGITFSNRPALGTSIGSLGPTATNTSYSVSLTAGAVTGELGQQLSLGLDSGSSDGLELNSKEAGSTAAPKLVLTLQK
ncbi:DNRLRE domain-containing protein [Arthrobacter sp. NPDC056727]|uniref:CBM96 family carbohydrate-binding protein n=1 Tax=Arthrobacter sp. NPDC056727 TaxID=3345927 RepID=UPI00366FD557